MVMLFEKFERKQSEQIEKVSIKDLVFRELGSDKNKGQIYDALKDYPDDDPIFILLYITSKAANNNERYLINNGILLTELKRLSEEDSNLFANALIDIKKDTEATNLALCSRKRSEFQKRNNLLLKAIKKHISEPNSYSQNKFLYWHFWGIYSLFIILFLAQ
ncbi:hypothetical protein [Thiomicrorhabdus sp. Milos-T2]|uniref:hypothetical protein n=1 Tax=Thiomicrorhabdus sp. Milos-T2 TaxID=90814 RepID=UPI000493D1E8|nr:hypothetical protein [Thiomicrorhabdus sp. Milos-T2]